MTVTAIPLRSMTDQEFADYCGQLDAEEARRGGFFSGDVLGKGDAAVAEAGRRRAVMSARRAAAALVLALLLAAGLAACTPASPPSHFGNCPAGQHWQQVKLSNFGWECES